MAKMNFVDRKRMKADRTINIVFRMCPMHLLKLDECIRDAKLNELIEIVTTYDGALDDIPAWCERTGNEFVGIDTDDEKYYLYVVKKNEWKKNLPGSCCDHSCI